MKRLFDTFWEKVAVAQIVAASFIGCNSFVHAQISSDEVTAAQYQISPAPLPINHWSKEIVVGAAPGSLEWPQEKMEEMRSYANKVAMQMTGIVNEFLAPFGSRGSAFVSQPGHAPQKIQLMIVWMKPFDRRAVQTRVENIESGLRAFGVKSHQLLSGQRCHAIGSTQSNVNMAMIFVEHDWDDKEAPSCVLSALLHSAGVDVGVDSAHWAKSIRKVRDAWSLDPETSSLLARELRNLRETGNFDQDGRLRMRMAP